MASPLRLLLVPVALLALLLGACGGNKSSSGSTTSTSEAESPIDDQAENTEFCAEWTDELSTAKDQVTTATAFTTLATDAPTEMQPQFEQIAEGLDMVNSGDQQQVSTGQTQIAAALPGVTSFMETTCPGVDISGLPALLGVSGTGTTTTKAN